MNSDNRRRDLQAAEAPYRTVPSSCGNRHRSRRVSQAPRQQRPTELCFRERDADSRGLETGENPIAQLILELTSVLERCVKCPHMDLETELIPARETNSKHLMIVLHGLGDSMEGYRWLPEVMNLPWLNYLLVNGPDCYYGGYSWFPYPGERATGIRRSRELVIRLLESLTAEGYAAKDLFLFGFSQGCLISVEVGVCYPHRLAGIVGISGWVDEPERLLAERSDCANSQRFLITHGVHDPLVPFSSAKRCFGILRDGGLQIEWHELAKEHTIQGETEMRVIRDFVRDGR